MERIILVGKNQLDKITPTEVCHKNDIGLKLARIASRTSRKDDSWVDIIGYAALGGGEVQSTMK